MLSESLVVHCFQHFLSLLNRLPLLSIAKVCLSVSIFDIMLSELIGVLELTHNHGTESDSNFSGYASGNTEPGKGYGHIAITVPNVAAACERFEKLGVPFKKKLTDGRMKDIAFILDPDG